jgi:hypothetical protein
MDLVGCVLAYWVWPAGLCFEKTIANTPGIIFCLHSSGDRILQDVGDDAWVHDHDGDGLAVSRSRPWQR